MNVETTRLPGVMILTPRRFEDARGFFSETWNRRALSEAGIDIDFVQDNHSMSRAAGTVRGLHYQRPPHAQAKLVRVTRGAVIDVAVDFRAGSPTFGQWVAVELNAGSGQQLFIPAGFLHGFVTLEPETEFLYKCSDYYAPDCDAAIRFDDPGLCIDWGIDTTRAIVSDKDRAAPLFADVVPPFRWEGTA